MAWKKPTRNLEEMIIDRLKQGAAMTIDVIAYIRRERPHTTKQGVYAAMRLLQREEKVAVHGRYASLNTLWIREMLESFSAAQRNYSERSITDDGFSYLKEGEKVHYVFRNPILADTFWSHALLVLTSAVPVEEPLYIYCPHEWFLLAREKSERALLNSIVDRGRSIRETIGHRDRLDNYISKEFKREGMKYGTLATPLFKEKNYYVNIVGGFIVETYLDMRVAEKIDEFYKQTPGWSPSVPAVLGKIIESPGKTKMTISKNEKRAARLVSLFGKA